MTLPAIDTCKKRIESNYTKLTNTTGWASRTINKTTHKIQCTINFNNAYQNMNTYKTKWNKFFQTTGLAKQTMASIESTSSEPEIPSEISDFQYPSDVSVSTTLPPHHFIYAAIDTPFDKGEMNKNIFVFEQFGDKIIPVGFLANNANSPLKFNVITRNPQTFKIEKVNNDALTFCEAMEYTGDKFSQYCGCKDGNNNVVTQFEKNAACNNSFGCKIKPIRPTNLAPKFKLF